MTNNELRKECKHEHFSSICNTCGIDMVSEQLKEVREGIAGMKHVKEVWSDKEQDNIAEEINCERNEALEEVLSLLDKRLEK